MSTSGGKAPANTYLPALSRPGLTSAAPYGITVTTVPTVTLTSTPPAGLIYYGVSPVASRIQANQIGVWTASTFYNQGQVVTTPDGQTQARLNAGTSSATYVADQVNWQPVGVYATFCMGGAFGNNNGANGWSANYISPQTFERAPASCITNYDGTKMAFKITSAPGHVYRVWVNNQPVTSWVPVVGSQDGAIKYVVVDFTSTPLAGVPKTVRLDGQNGDVFAIYAGATETLAAVKPNGPLTIVTGDSYGGGAGPAPPTGYTGISSFVYWLAAVMGWEDVWNSCIGGSGYLNGTNLLNRYQADIVAFKPDLSIIPMGHNDIGTYTPAQIQAAAQTIIGGIRSGSPNTAIWVTGPFFTGASITGYPNPTWVPIQAAITAAATAAGANLISDTVNDINIYTGTGFAGSPTGSGNGDIYIQSDNTHPNQAGAIYLGQRLAQILLSALTTAL